MARRNESVEKFQRLTVELKRRVYNDAVAELAVQSDRLMETMRSAVPYGPTGDLAKSIRKESDRQGLLMRIKAGGLLTMRLHGGDERKPYDYARAVEFGTEKMNAHPFFFPSYRLMRKTMKAAMKRKITKTIKQYSATE
jgi:HK97 gp10 family phage protein